jgi:hypothetical protein
MDTGISVRSGQLMPHQWVLAEVNPIGIPTEQDIIALVMNSLNFTYRFSDKKILPGG